MGELVVMGKLAVGVGEVDGAGPVATPGTAAGPVGMRATAVDTVARAEVATTGPIRAAVVRTSTVARKCQPAS